MSRGLILQRRHGWTPRLHLRGGVLVCRGLGRCKRRTVRCWHVLHGGRRARGNVHERGILVSRRVLITNHECLQRGVLRLERRRGELFERELRWRVHMHGGLLLWRFQHAHQRQHLPRWIILRWGDGSADSVHKPGGQLLSCRECNRERRGVSDRLLLREHVCRGVAVRCGVLLPRVFDSAHAVRHGVLWRSVSAGVRYKHLLRRLHPHRGRVLPCSIVHCGRNYVPGGVLVQQHGDDHGVQHRGHLLRCGNGNGCRRALRGGKIRDVCRRRGVHKQQLRGTVHVRRRLHL